MLKAATFLRAALDAPLPAQHRDESAVSYDVSGRVSTAWAVEALHAV